MPKLALFLVCLFVVGCATTAKYEAKLNSWIGSSEEALVAAWGAPDQVYTLNDGKKAIAYIRKSAFQSGGYSYTVPRNKYYSGKIGNETFSATSTEYVTESVPTQIHRLYCKTTFLIDNLGKVIHWHHEGNNCVSP